MKSLSPYWLRLVMTENRKELGQRIQAIRKRAGMTQEKLASLVPMEEKSLSRIERGVHYPSIETLETIAAALGVRFIDFFDYMDNKTDEAMRAEINAWTANLSGDDLHRIHTVLRTMIRR